MYSSANLEARLEERREELREVERLRFYTQIGLQDSSPRSRVPLVCFLLTMFYMVFGH